MPSFEEVAGQERDLFKKQQGRIQSQARAAEQGQVGAIRRRFAALGGLQSGAAIKQEQLARQGVQEQAQAAQEGLAEKQAQRDLARAEAAAQRGFQSSEAQKQREFAGTEAQKGRDFQQKLSDRDFEFRKNVFAFEKEAKLKQLDMARQQFALEADIARFNKDIAEKEQARQSRGFLGNLGSDIFGEGTAGKVGGAFLTGGLSLL